MEIAINMQRSVEKGDGRLWRYGFLWEELYRFNGRNLGRTYLGAIGER